MSNTNEAVKIDVEEMTTVELDAKEEKAKYEKEPELDLNGIKRKVLKKKDGVKEALEANVEIRDTTYYDPNDEDIEEEYVNEQHSLTMFFQKQMKMMVSTYYDLQKTRTSTGNRLVGNFLLRIGGKDNMKSDDEDKKIIEQIVGDWNSLADELTSSTKIRNYFANHDRRDGFIASEYEHVMTKNYLSIRQNEIAAYKDLTNFVKKFPIYTEFLSKIKGCGPAMSAILIAKLNPYAAKHTSSFWKYAGLDVINGEGRTAKKRHQIVERYITKDKHIAYRMSLTFCPFLKAKLLGVLMDSFIKCGRDSSKYNTIYYDIKERYHNDPKHSSKSDGHIHKMSKRYAIKIFLADLWVAMREMEGLPVSNPYAEDKLGLKH
jgi:hypothetical protein